MNRKKTYQHRNLLHNENGPSIQNQCGCSVYMDEGFKHRIFGPAIVNGKKCSGCFKEQQHNILFKNYYFLGLPGIVVITLILIIFLSVFTILQSIRACFFI